MTVCTNSSAFPFRKTGLNLHKLPKWLNVKEHIVVLIVLNNCSSVSKILGSRF